MKISNWILLIIGGILLSLVLIYYVIPHNMKNINPTVGAKVIGDETIASETRNVPEFNSVKVSGPFHVVVNLQQDDSVTLTGDGNVLPLIKTEVKDGTLHVYSEISFLPKSQLNLTISTNNIDALSSWSNRAIEVNNMANKKFILDLNGNSTFKATGKTELLKIDCWGAANINTSELIADYVELYLSGDGSTDVYALNALSVSLSGAGSFNAHGRTEYLKINSNGATSIDTENLIAKDVSISLKGAGQASVFASNTLQVNITGIGKVTYFGDPKFVNPNIIGFGKAENGDNDSIVFKESDEDDIL